jgi:tRNA dimethylallyltransferase
VTEGADPLVVLAGPTGTGKSGLSLDLADAFATRGRTVEIVGADAMQLYRGMDIGTAKLSLEARRGVPHHLIDTLDPSETSTVAAYQLAARAAIADIRSRGNLPFLVGGSGLYVSSVIQPLDFPGTDPAIREGLEAQLADLGSIGLWTRLRDQDRAAALAIDAANGRRIVRALEVIAITGRPYSAVLPEQRNAGERTRTIVLDVEPEQRPALKETLARRVQQMFAHGLVAEVEALTPEALGPTARRAIGYAQAVAVLEGRQSLEEAIAETVQLTVRYVRRQRSWFGRYRDAHRLDAIRSDLVSAAAEVILGDPAADGPQVGIQ